VLLKFQSIYQAASTALPWPVTVTLPPSSARRFVVLPVLGLILVRCYVPTTVGIANSRFMGSGFHADTYPTTPSLGECFFMFVSQFSSDASYSHVLGYLGAVKCVAQTLKRLPDCGHSAIMACSIDPSTFKCKKICGVACPRAHPCPLLCSDDCGDCQFPIYRVELPCGHTPHSIPWRELFFFRLPIPF